MFFISLEVMKNVNNFRRKLNGLFVDYGAGYGSSLPSDAPEGKLFYLLPGNDPYQYRSGVWTAL
jgi:hypothetical protein